MDDSARESLFRRWLGDYAGIVRRTARSFASVPADQDDLLQEILLQLWRSTASFVGEAHPSTWVYRVALNAALTWKRDERRRRRWRSLRPEDPEPSSPATDAHTMEYREVVEQLYGAIRRLPPIDRSLVILYLDGLSYRQVGEVLGVSEVNVGVRLHRARRKLAEFMGVDDEPR